MAKKSQPNTFASKVSQYMAARSLAPRKFAALVGVSRGAIRGWLETGSEPTLGALRGIAEHTGIDVNYWADDSIPVLDEKVARALCDKIREVIGSDGVAAATKAAAQSDSDLRMLLLRKVCALAQELVEFSGSVLEAAPGEVEAFSRQLDQLRQELSSKTRSA